MDLSECQMEMMEIWGKKDSKNNGVSIICQIIQIISNG